VADCIGLENRQCREAFAGSNPAPSASGASRHAARLSGDCSKAQPCEIEQALSGTPVDPEAARAVHDRAARITEEIYRLHGEINMATINALFGDDDET
jgi:hypothetical protein